ncbi:MAG: ABC transporter substrate-binding protein, partial [Chloroflexi bacterium]|nr:ABC transporter substrate-binding protein [Chloroflexota bacterium]
GPFEGQHRAVGYDVIYSARLAVREINAAGGIGGHRVALVALDDSGDPDLARETAVSLTLDPAVVAVIGHWQPETTAVAAGIYQEAGLLFINTNAEPFNAADPATYSAKFHEAYASITPFDETAGPHAAAAYEAFTQLWGVMADVAEADGVIERGVLVELMSGE